MPIAVNDIIDGSLQLVQGEAVYGDKNRTLRAMAPRYLDAVINEMNSCAEIIPYWSEVFFTMQPGKGVYRIGTVAGADVTVPSAPVLAEFISARYPGSTVIWNVTLKTNAALRITARLDSVQARPEMAVSIRGEGYTDYTFYPKPSAAYECGLLYKGEIGSAGPNMQIDLPERYYMYLQYALGKLLMGAGNLGEWTPQKEETLVKAKASLSAASEKDHTVITKPPMSAGYYNGFYGGRGYWGW